MQSRNRIGFRWSINEVLQLQREFELLNLDIYEIAKRHGRTPNAIMHKLDAEGFADYNELSSKYIHPHDVDSAYKFVAAVSKSVYNEETLLGDDDAEDDNDSDEDYVDNGEEEDDDDEEEDEDDEEDQKNWFGIISERLSNLRLDVDIIKQQLVKLMQANDSKNSLEL